MKKYAVILLLLLICLNICGCNDDNKKADIELFDIQLDITKIAPDNDASIFAYDTDDKGNIYYIANPHTGEVITYPGLIGEIYKLEELDTKTLTIADSKGKVNKQYTFKETDQINHLVYNDNSIIYLRWNYEMLLGIEYTFGEDTPEVLFNVEGCSNIRQLEKIGNHIYILALDDNRKREYHYLSDNEKEYLGETLLSINLTDLTVEIIDYEWPLLISKGTDDKLLIHGKDGENGFYVSVYDPLNRTELKMEYVKNELINIANCGTDIYITYDQSIDANPSLNICSFNHEGTMEVPIDFELGIKPRYNNGILYTLSSGQLYSTDITGRFDFEDKKQINIISPENPHDLPKASGYLLNKQELGYEGFALTVLSLDPFYDISYIRSQDRHAANIRDKGSFYPLNDVEGVAEYIDACFPAIKEAAINNDGYIWMLPLTINTPYIFYNKDVCNELDIVFSDNMSYGDVMDIVNDLYVDGEYKTPFYISDIFVKMNMLSQYIQNNTTFNTDIFKEWAAYIKNDVNEKAFEYSSKYRSAGSSFEGQRTIVFQYGTDVNSLSHYVDRVGGNYGVVPLPPISDAYKNNARCVFLVVNPNSQNLETTLSYISRLAKSMADESKKSYNIQNAKIYSEHEAYADYARMLNNSEVSFSISDDIYLNDFFDYMDGKKTLDEFIKEADRKLNAYLNE